MRNFWPIAFFILIQTTFDCFAIRSTHWAVFCNCGIYLSVSWMAYRLSAPYYKLKKIPYYSAIAGFMVLFVLMALKWPLSYDDYKNSMGKMESVVPFCFVLIGGFIYYLINERHKRLG